MIRQVSVGLVLLLAACGSDPQPFEVNKMASQVAYSCENGRSLQALYRAGEAAVHLAIEGQTLVLPQVAATSGIAFSNGTLTFHAEGQRAFTEGWGGGDYIGCVVSN